MSKQTMLEVIKNLIKLHPNLTGYKYFKILEKEGVVNSYQGVTRNLYLLERLGVIERKEIIIGEKQKAFIWKVK